MARDDRTLVIVRHAKAQAFAEEDRLRPLTAGGRRAATDVGRWLAARGLVPDAALVSEALRARQTWVALADGLAGAGLTAPEPVHDSALYSAGTDTAMECLRTAPPDARCVVLVGHNPTVASLVQLLGDGEGDSETLRQVTAGYPPAAVAVFTVTCAWAELDLGCARLQAAHVPPS